ncbi:hypothetical protein G6F46_003450 [Rhizopus delemar]|nr:hypothetical protein G6F46_003450 [Rhizopus delemar]
MSSLLGSIELADFPEGTAYRIAKSGLNMLTKLQSTQLAKENFVVYASHPGLVKTDMSVDISKTFPDLVINPDESISKQLAKLDNATAADSGKLIDYEGQFTVDTAQVVNAHYKRAEAIRLHGRAATEISEQLLTIKAGELSAEEANQLLDEALESAKRLAIHVWVQGYHQVLNTWKQRSQEAGEKPLANSLLQNTTKLTTSNEYLKQQSPVPQLKEVEEDISRIQLGTTLEEDVDSMDEVEQKTILGGEDVGPQPSTATVTSAILTVQHQQTIQHREHPVSNATQITTLTTTTSINTTDSTTINTIKPYYKLNNKLHHSLRWHPTGQSPTTFSPLLENNNQSPLAPISNSKWLQDLIFQETDPMEESKESDNNRRSTSHQRSNTEILGWRDNRGISYTKSAIPLQVLYRKRRLHLQNRFKGRVCSYSNACRLPRFPKFRERRSCLQIQIPCVRPQCSTKDFLQNHALCHRTSEERMDSNHLLFGRHLHLGEDKARDEPSDNQIKAMSRETRLPHQLQKEFLIPSKTQEFLGFAFNSKTMMISVP